MIKTSPKELALGFLLTTLVDDRDQGLAVFLETGLLVKFIQL